MGPQRRQTDAEGSTSWIERYIKPLITLCIFLGMVLAALQMWIASSFVTRDELEKLRTTLMHSHEDHMDDYRKIQSGVEDIERMLRSRENPRNRERGSE